MPMEFEEIPFSKHKVSSGSKCALDSQKRQADISLMYRFYLILSLLPRQKNHLNQQPPIFWAPGTGSMDDSFPWAGGCVIWFHTLPRSCMCADRASLSCTAWFLAGHGQVLVCALGVGDP